MARGRTSKDEASTRPDRQDATAATDGAGPRILIFSGKGGVGKTTLAAATGLHTARSGKSTIIISIDVAHSLADAFDLGDGLTRHPRGTPYRVEKNLDIQEIDIQEEVFRHWREVHQYFSVLFAESGIQEVVAEDLALIPGMEDVIALLYLNEYSQDNRYDVIVLDLAPTGESLRFVSMPDTLDWYMRRVYKFERGLVRVARPFAKRLSKVPLPDESYFKEIERLWSRLDGVDRILTDPQQTTVRLVTNPERMVIQETKRAHLYFSLHGVVVDEILINRVLPETARASAPAFFSGWYESQEKNLRRIRDDFPDLPMHTVPLMEDEVVGKDRLARLAESLYGPPGTGRDPTGRHGAQTPYRLETTEDQVHLRVHLPHLDKRSLDLWVEREELILRVASQKHHLPLPRRLSRQQPVSARHEAGWLTVAFERQAAEPGSAAVENEAKADHEADPDRGTHGTTRPVNVQTSTGGTTHTTQGEGEKDKSPRREGERP